MFDRTGLPAIAALIVLLAPPALAAGRDAEVAGPQAATLTGGNTAVAEPASDAADPAGDDQAAASNDDQTAAQEAPLTEEQEAALRDALNAKLDELSDLPGAQPKQRSGAAALDWDRAARSNGTTYTVKRALPVDWNAKVGADLGVSDNSTRIDPEPAALTTPAKNTGSAWANVQMPGVASFDARVGAGSEPSKFGMSRTVPLGGVTSLTLQNSYTMADVAAASPGLPPPAGASTWSNDRQVKFSITPTGTTFGAGTSGASVGGAAHNKLSAEQKLFEKFNVTTTFNDVGEASASRSITAGFKTQW